MSDIFISYASADRDRARLLADALSKRGYSVWWDRTIPPGRVFDEVIQEAIQGAKCMIVLWSSASVSSNWVKTEAAEGAARDILVPALIGEVTLPIEFKRIQAANLLQWEGDETDGEYLNLLESVESLMKQAPRIPGSAESAVKTYRPATRAARSYWGTIKIFGMGVVATAAIVVSVWLFGQFGKQRDATPPVANTSESAKVMTNSAPAPAASTNERANPSTPATAQTNPPLRGRMNLLAEENGGQLLVASKDDWKKFIDGKEDTDFYADGGFGVFGFRDEKSALIDTLSILIPDQRDYNIKEFELFISNANVTGPFESIGRFSTQNLRIMQNPYQEFRFSPVKAKYVKFLSLRNHAGSSDVIQVYEMRLFGTLQ